MGHIVKCQTGAPGICGTPSQYLGVDVQEYATAQSMMQDPCLKLGYAHTLGFYEVGDGGEAYYTVVASPTGDLPNGMDVLKCVRYVAELNAVNYIKPEQIGALGDGETDCTNYFNRLKTITETIVLEKSYKTNTILIDRPITFTSCNENKSFIGDTANYPSILTDSDYTFIFNEGVLNSHFIGIKFEGGGINGVFGSNIDSCAFVNCNTALNNCRGGYVSNSSFTGCKIGIYNMTDSRVENSTFSSLSDTAIELINSGSSSIVNNKIQWCNRGIYLENAVHIIITNNILDRMTTYGIERQAGSQTVISNNIFLRNLINHIYGRFGYSIITGNYFFSMNSEDDGSGSIVPLSPLAIVSIGHCVVSDNFIQMPEGNKVFSSIENYSDNVAWGNNIVNSVNFTKIHSKMEINVSDTNNHIYQYSISEVFPGYKTAFGLRNYSAEIRDNTNGDI